MREIHWSVASRTPTGTHNPGVCPNWESDWPPSGLQAGTQSTEPHQPRRLLISYLSVLKRPKNNAKWVQMGNPSAQILVSLYNFPLKRSGAPSKTDSRFMTDKAQGDPGLSYWTKKQETKTPEVTWATLKFSLAWSGKN